MRLMKDSGISGIGKIPESYKISRIKYLTDIFGRIGFRGYTEQDLVDEDEGPITLSPSNFKNMHMTYEKCSYISWDKYYESPEIMIHDGDILMVKTGSTYGKSCLVTGLPMEATINPQLLVFKNLKINTGFFAYFLQTDYITDLCELAVVGSTIPTMSQAKIGNFQIIIPPESEQAKITDYLDKKCSEIDTIFNEIQAQIAILEQYRSSVISEAVTRGLNESTDRYDAGIDWIGNVPKQWKAFKGKYLFAQRSLRGNSKELQLLSPTQKYGVIPQAMYEEISGMSAVKLNDSTDLQALKNIHKGDYCISLRSFQGGFEYSEYEGVVSPAYQVFFPIVKVADGYYRYLFKERSFIEKINSYTMTLRDGKNIAFSDFGNTYIPYPPVEEQEAIASYLDEKCAGIDSVIADKRNQLEVIERYKKSLIFEYVTGKKEVPA